MEDLKSHRKSDTELVDMSLNDSEQYEKYINQMQANDTLYEKWTHNKNPYNQHNYEYCH